MAQKGIIYCRVSSQDQVKGTSLEGQRQACETYARDHGIDVVEVFIEKGESATAADRTELNKALDLCRTHKNGLTAFIVYKLDRFSRSMVDFYALKAELAKLGIRIRSTTEPVNDGPVGQMTEAMLAGYAQFENDVRKQRCEGGMKRLIAQGIRPWPPPLGYVHSKERHDKRKTEPDLPDPNRFPIIQRGLKEYAEGGVSIAQLTKMLNAWGLRSRRGNAMGIQRVEIMLRNSFYAGIVTDPWTGEEFRGKHEPMINWEEYQRIQQIKAGNSCQQNIPHATHNPDFPLRMFVRCACGNGLTGAWTQGRSKKYPYYRCKSHQCVHYGHGIMRDGLEEKFLALLKRVTPKPPVLKVFQEFLVEEYKVLIGNRIAEKTRYEAELKRLEENKRALVQLRVDGELTKEEFMEQKEKLEQRIVVGRISCNEAAINAFDIETKATFAVRLVQNVAEQWQSLEDIDLKQELQSLVFPDGLTFDKDTDEVVHRGLSPIFALADEISQTKKDRISSRSLMVAGVGFAPTTSWL